MDKPTLITTSRVVATNNLPLRDGPSFSAKPLQFMPRGLNVIVLNGTAWLEQSLWIEVEVGGTKGWCVANGVVSG